MRQNWHDGESLRVSSVKAVSDGERRLGERLHVLVDHRAGHAGAA